MAIICSCHAVTTAAARQWIDAGASTVDALGNCSGAGSDCGGCLPTLDALIAEYAGPRAEKGPPCRETKRSSQS